MQSIFEMNGKNISGSQIDSNYFYSRRGMKDTSES